MLLDSATCMLPFIRPLLACCYPTSQRRVSSHDASPSGSARINVLTAAGLTGIPVGEQGVCCAYILKNAADPKSWQLVCNRDINRVSRWPLPPDQ